MTLLLDGSLNIFTNRRKSALERDTPSTLQRTDNPVLIMKDRPVTMETITFFSLNSTFRRKGCATRIHPHQIESLGTISNKSCTASRQASLSWRMHLQTRNHVSVSFSLCWLIFFCTVLTFSFKVRLFWCWYEIRYGQTNCWVHPDIEYGAYETKDGEVCICTERSARSNLKNLFFASWQNDRHGFSRTIERKRKVWEYLEDQRKRYIRNSTQCSSLFLSLHLHSPNVVHSRIKGKQYIFIDSMYDSIIPTGNWNSY